MTKLQKQKEKLKLKKFNDKIKEKNAKFNALPKWKKRVAIAKDVINSLKIKRYKAENCVYIDAKLKQNEKFDLGKPVELQTLFLTNKIKSCSVCAVGSLFTSKIILGNKYKTEVTKKDWEETLEIADCTKEENSEYNLISTLSGIFSEEELRIIELAFEGFHVTTRFESVDVTSDEYIISSKCFKFFKKYKNTTNRLIKIMENIITNEGEFKP